MNPSEPPLEAPALEGPSFSGRQSLPPSYGIPAVEAAPRLRHIYALRLLKLGDTWAAVSWLLQQSNVALSNRTRRPGHGHDVVSLVMEIVSLFRTERELEIVPARRPSRIPEMTCLQHEYLPTRMQWRPNESRLICVHFDGSWQARRKNPREKEKRRFFAAINGAGFEVVVLGKALGLTACVSALATCYCFVGVDSGMMHVANSVRCPRILVRNRMTSIDAIYSGKGLMVARNLDAVLALLLGPAVPAPV